MLRVFVVGLVDHADCHDRQFPQLGGEHQVDPGSARGSGTGCAFIRSLCPSVAKMVGEFRFQRNDKNLL